MRFGPFSSLLVSLAASSLTTAFAAPSAEEPASSPSPKVAGPKKPAEILELKPKTWESTIGKGNWFIKFYSPSCGHCKIAAPYWAGLANHYTTTPVSDSDFTTTYDFHFANLNCLAYGDFCGEQEITAYPSFRIYRDGKLQDTHTGFNGMEKLTKFTETYLEKLKPGSRPAEIPKIEKLEEEEKPASGEEGSAPKAGPPPPSQTEEPAATEEAKPKPTGPVPNPDGKSFPLVNEKFQQKIIATRDKWFVKFYAPWCGHCQAMAPAWYELGKEMKGQLNIGEVNCEIEKRLCKDLGIRGYPTIIYFENGGRVEYDGLRGVGDLISYARKAVDSGIKEIDRGAFETLENKGELEVAFVYLYDEASTSEDFEALNRLTLHLIGHAPLYKSRDNDFAERFRIHTRPKLLVIRDGRPQYYNALSPRDLRNHNRVLDWMRSTWLPIVPELSAANSHQVMNKRIVVLGILSRERKDQFAQAKVELKKAALEYMEQRSQEEIQERKELRNKKQLRMDEAEDRGDDRAYKAAKKMKVDIKERKEVGFAWVDGIFWERWVRSTYGVNVKEDHERIIINDEDNKQYWDTTIENSPITPSRLRIKETLDYVLASPPKIRSKSTNTKLENVFFTLRTSMRNHPWVWLGILTASLFVGALWGRGRMKRRAGGFFRLDGKEGLLGGSGVAQGKVD